MGTILRCFDISTSISLKKISLSNMKFLQILAVFLLHILLPVDATLSEAEVFLANDYETTMTKACLNLTVNRLEFQTDLMNDTKLEGFVDSLYQANEHLANLSQKLRSFKVPFIIDDQFLAREIKIASSGPSFEALPSIRKTIKTLADMDRAFNVAKVCPYHNQSCELATEGLSVTEISDVMAESRDYEELTYLWKMWREATADLKGMFRSYHELEDNITKVNSDNGVEKDEDDNGILGYTMDLWKQVEPLYQELHTYVSRKLKMYYRNKVDISDGLLPAHVLGSLWAENWYNIEPIVRPFPNVSDGNLEENMQKLFTVEDIFRSADRFYQSLGLITMESAFVGHDRMITKPTDGKEVSCYPNSSDFCNGTYKIIVCAKVNLENYLTIYHELGHVQYFIQYDRRPITLRDSPSPAFHEAIGGIFGLSAASPKRLRKLGILTNYHNTYESSINFLMKMALIKIPFLPFTMILETWRNKVVHKKLAEEKWNPLWWKYREKYQRIKAPIPRSNATDFDAGSHYLMAVNARIMVYYHAHFMEFQIYKAMCLLVKEYNPDMKKICPLYNCDFHNFKEVGKKMEEALRMGNLIDWTRKLKMLTGSSEILSEPLLEYFQPLYEFLKKENEKPFVFVEEEKETVPEPPVPKAVHHTVATVMIFLIIVIICVVIYLKFWKRWRSRINAIVRGR